MAQTAVSAVGGYVLFYPTELDLLNEDPITLEVETWVGNWACEYMGMMPSGSGAGMLYLPTGGTPVWNITLPLDTEQAPDLLDITQGMVIYVALFKRGNEYRTADPIFDEVDLTTITGISMVNANGKDAVRVLISGMGGNVFQGVT